MHACNVRLRPAHHHHLHGDKRLDHWNDHRSGARLAACRLAPPDRPGPAVSVARVAVRSVPRRPSVHTPARARPSDDPVDDPGRPSLSPLRAISRAVALSRDPADQTVARARSQVARRRNRPAGHTGRSTCAPRARASAWRHGRGSGNELTNRPRIGGGRRGRARTRQQPDRAPDDDERLLLARSAGEACARSRPRHVALPRVWRHVNFRAAYVFSRSVAPGRDRG